jgi:hypothetical protein
MKICKKNLRPGIDVRILFKQGKYVKIVHNLELNQRPPEFGLNNENM